MFALQKLSRLNGCLITGFSKCNPGARTSHSLYLWNNQMSGDITFLRKSKHSQKNNWNGSGVQKICQRRTPSRGLKICLPRTKHPNISFNVTSTATRLLIWYTRLDSITICSVFFWEVSTQPWVFTSDVPNLCLSVLVHGFWSGLIWGFCLTTCLSLPPEVIISVAMKKDNGDWFHRWF